MAKKVIVGGRIESKEVGGIVTGAAEILDDSKGKKQSVINQETDAELERLDGAKQNVLTFDNVPTEGSDNPVKSAGVYAADKALSDAIEAILLLIPGAASALNKLVDMAMMNSSISTATATFRGTYNVVTDLELAIDATHEQIAAKLGEVINTADNNDYAFVQVPVSAESTDIRRTERYKFNGTAWEYEYDLNTSGFTAAQWAAINSGITLALVGKLIGLPTSSELQALLGQKQDTLTFDNVPTSGSNNPVKSGGVYSDINDEKTAREQLAQSVAGINGRLGNVEEVIPSGAAANNKLVANNSMEAYVASIIDAITASFTIATADGHINLTLTQTNGRVASLTLTSSDIASAQALTALTGRVSTAEGNITTLGGRVSTNETDIANLQQLYNNLQQSKPIPVTALPETGQQQGVIYRLAGTTSYSDYMWNGSTWVLMATYNNAIDPRPKKASQNLVTSGGVFDNMGALDVSELNATENPHTLAQYVDLSAALAAIPTDYQKGGMSIKFVQSSDNKYVQYRLMADDWSTTVSDWQGVDEEPTSGSDNLVKSGGVAEQLQQINIELNGGKKYYADETFNLNNQFIDANTIYCFLSEPVDTCRIKLSVPNGSGITKYGIRLWDENDNTYSLPIDDGPNVESVISKRSYNITKIAVSSVSPDVRYTGDFRFEIYDELEASVAKKDDLDNVEMQLSTKVSDVESRLRNTRQFIGKFDIKVESGNIVGDNNIFVLKAKDREKLTLLLDESLYISNNKTLTVYQINKSSVKTVLIVVTPGVEREITLSQDIEYISIGSIENVNTGHLSGYSTLNISVDSNTQYDDRDFVVPGYYFENDYIDNKVSTIRNLVETCSVDSDTFIFQTDVHWELNAQNSLALIKYISNKVPITKLFDGGDTTHYIDKDGTTHMSEYAISFSTLRKNAFNGDIFHIIGNHEYLTHAYTDINKFTGVDFDNWHDMQYYAEAQTVVYGDVKQHYYYVDNNQKRIRYIVLSSYKKKEEPYLRPDTKYNTLAEFNYDAEQLEWFTGTALNVESGWTIVVMAHQLVAISYSGDPITATPWVHFDNTRIRAFARALLQYDGNGEIACMMCGHSHCDAVLDIDDNLVELSGAEATGKKIPLIITTSDCNNIESWTGSVHANRDSKTINEQAFDVVVLNKKIKKIFCIRIGAPAYNRLVPDGSGNYPTSGNIEVREIYYGNV